MITFYYKRALTDYTVRYIDKDSGEDIAEPVQWEGCYVGDVVESRARIISGYELDDETTKQIELSKDSTENIIIFEYVKIPKYTLTYHVVGDTPEGPIVPAKVTDILKGRDVTLAAPLTYTDSGELPMESYTVKYLEIGTDKEVAKTKVVPNVKVETQITERALNVPGYRLVSDETQPITI